MIKLTIRSDYYNDIVIYFEDHPQPEDILNALRGEMKSSLHPTLALTGFLKVLDEWGGAPVFRGITFRSERIFIYPVGKVSAC